MVDGGARNAVALYTRALEDGRTFRRRRPGSCSRTSSSAMPARGPPPPRESPAADRRWRGLAHVRRSALEALGQKPVAAEKSAGAESVRLLPLAQSQIAKAEAEKVTGTVARSTADESELLSSAPRLSVLTYRAYAAGRKDARP